MCAQTSSLSVCTRYVPRITETRLVRKFMSGSQCRSAVTIYFLLSLLIPDMETRKLVSDRSGSRQSLFWWFYIDLSAVGWVRMGCERSIDYKFPTTDLVLVQMLALLRGT